MRLFQGVGAAHDAKDAVTVRFQNVLADRHQVGVVG